MVSEYREDADQREQEVKGRTEDSEPGEGSLAGQCDFSPAASTAQLLEERAQHGNNRHRRHSVRPEITWFSIF